MIEARPGDITFPLGHRRPADTALPRKGFLGQVRRFAAVTYPLSDRAHETIMKVWLTFVIIGISGHRHAFGPAKLDVATLASIKKVPPDRDLTECTETI